MNFGFNSKSLVLATLDGCIVHMQIKGKENNFIVSNVFKTRDEGMLLFFWNFRTVKFLKAGTPLLGTFLGSKEFPLPLRVFLSLISGSSYDLIG